MTLKELDDRAQAAFRLASCISIFVLAICGFLFCLMAEEIEQFGQMYREEAEEIQAIRLDSRDFIDHTLRQKRQSFYQRRNHNSRFGQHNRHRAGDGPRICDCTIVQCPRGARGAPGSDGEPAEDGLPGVHGKPGLDGIFLVEEIQCPPCPRGPKGPDGDPGEKGEQGKTGIPGAPGVPGTNEPGAMGEPGNRGQPGRPGKKGTTGEPGQDAVQLIGTPGQKGPDGSPGFPGPRGDPGENGAPAMPGPEGLSGPEGEPGDDGEYGPRGPPGRKGSPGPDGGYCQCPPREGTGIASTSGGDSLPLTWEEYRRGTIRTAAIPESRQFSRKIPSPRLSLPPERIPQSEEDEDIYPRPPPYTRNRQFIDVPQAKITHSPMIPLIDYRDSREGVTNRVVMSRKRPVVRGGSVDFDLRRKKH